MTSFYPYPSGQATLAGAKARLNIYDLWQHYGYPGEPKASCRSPFREDRKPSFSVSADGMLWNDFATGEAGDAVAFLQRASGLSQKEACRKFIQLAAGYSVFSTQATQPRSKPAEVRPKPVLPDFQQGTPADFQQLAALREIPREGLEWAGERGLLHFATLKDHRVWIVTDKARMNAQARRLDGHGLTHLEDRPKAWTLPGSWANWPIGILEAQPFPAIALCEGGPDFLATHYIVLREQAYTKREVRCSPVAMLGASLRIHPEALRLFTGKRIRIFGDNDEAGRAAVERWARQLASVGADVDAFSFAGLHQVGGGPVKDVNDSLLMDVESFAKAGRMLP